MLSAPSKAKAAGKKRFGIQAVAERIRWEILIETQAGSGFKLPNGILSRYARLIMEQESDLKGFFCDSPAQELVMAKKKSPSAPKLEPMSPSQVRIALRDIDYLYEHADANLYTPEWRNARRLRIYACSKLWSEGKQ